jgi:hypothetical protein
MKCYPLPLSMFLLILPANSGLAELAASTGAEKFPVDAESASSRRVGRCPRATLCEAITFDRGSINDANVWLMILSIDHCY